MKFTIALVIVMTFFCFGMAQTLKNKNYNLIIGTYTNQDKSNGIHVYAFNAETGKVTEKAKTVEVTNPSYLAVSKDNKNLYSVSEAGPGKSTISAFAFDAASGELKLLNSVGAGGNGPCYVSVDERKQFVFAGNYGDGSLTAIPVNKDGSLKSETQTIKHEGSGVNKSRQDKPHVHSVVLSPDERFLLTPDLGTDKVNIYRFDPAKPNPLSPADPPFATVKPGAGPRHLTFHPNGKFAYLVLEMEGAVHAFEYKNGTLKTLQSITMLATGFNGKVGAADIHISPDGKFLYASNRGEANEVVIYGIGKDGKLNYTGRQAELINTPRNFAIDPTGKFLLVANQNSNDVVIFKRDPKTGLLTATPEKISVDKPVCLKFVPVK